MTSLVDSFQQRCQQGRCRSCGREGLLGVLDLGEMPLADGLLTNQQLDGPEPRYPLELAFCAECSLVQILETVPPREAVCLPAVDFEALPDFGATESQQNERCADVGKLGLLRTEKFASGRDVEEQVAHLDRRARRTPDLAHIQQLAARQ